VQKPEIVRVKVPSALTTDCASKQRGPLPTTQQLVDRLVYTEGALDECAAKVRKIRQWNARN
jgi:hypothetical protein